MARWSPVRRRSRSRARALPSLPAFRRSGAGFCVFCRVAQPFQAGRPVLVEERAQLRHGRGIGPVHPPGAVSALCHEVGLLEHGEVLGDGRPGDLGEPVGDVGRRQLLRPDQPQDGSAPGLGQCLEGGVHVTIIRDDLRKCQLNLAPPSTEMDGGVVCRRRRGVACGRMAGMHDLIIRGGTVVDGTGRPGYTADVAVDGGRITSVGRVEGSARETIDADGLLVTPGFVDPHTHYDGQVTWDPLLTPSCWHGVTTAVLGNCGVGFAPVRPDRREWLVQLMEGVEDIPGTALHEGIRWAWESFPEYLDALETMPHAIDVAAQLPHGALRAYVMGERGAANERATDADIAEMARLAGDAATAGAVGFSTNRLAGHRAKDGRPVPGTFAADDEMLAIAGALRGAVVELVSSEAMGGVPDGFRRDVELAEQLSTVAGTPVTFCLSQVDTAPDQWREVLGWIEAADGRGARIVPQVAGRPLGLLLGLTTKHVFGGRPSFDEVAHLPLPELVQALRDTERRRRILAEPVSPGVAVYATKLADKAFPLGDDLDYEPDPATSVGAAARREGRRDR